MSCGFVGNADDYITYFRMFDYSTGISFAKFEVPSGAFVFLKEREKMEEFIKDRFLEVKDHLSDGTLEKLEEQLFGEPEVAEARPLTKEERRKLYDK